MLEQELKKLDPETEAEHPMKDEEVVSRVVGGQKELYALIIRRYNQRLYRIGLSIINSESAIEDVMQNTYIKAYENLSKFRFESAFSTWIIRIMVNECLQYLKARDRSTTKEFSFHTGILKQDEQTPLRSMINTELKKLLELSIRSLPDKYRVVFVMRELENMSVAETMTCLDISEANVKVRLNRAKVMLRDKLNNYVKGEELLQLYKPRCNRVVEYVMERI